MSKPKYNKVKIVLKLLIIVFVTVLEMIWPTWWGILYLGFTAFVFAMMYLVDEYLMWKRIYSGEGEEDEAD